MRSLHLLVLPLALAACSPSPAAPTDAGRDALDVDAECPAGILGDPTKPIDLQLRVLDANGDDQPIADGGDVAVIFPPQGGRVIFVGVRARNLDGCAVQLTGALRDESTRQVRVDARTVNLNPTGDGWGTSGEATQTISDARASYANVPVCPNQWATVDVFDHEFSLEVSLQDKSGRTANGAVKVIPRCAEPDRAAECRCICKAGYILGEACDLDGGTDG